MSVLVSNVSLRKLEGQVPLRRLGRRRVLLVPQVLLLLLLLLVVLVLQLAQLRGSAAAVVTLADCSDAAALAAAVAQPGADEVVLDCVGTMDVSTVVPLTLSAGQVLRSTAADPASVVLDAGGSAGPIITADGSTVRGLTLANGRNAGGQGGCLSTVRRAGAVTTCENVRFISCTAQDGGGMLVNMETEALVRNCLFSGCVADDKGGGLAALWSTALLRIENSTFTGCSTVNGGGNNGGGALHVHETEAQLLRTLFDGNAATAHKGAAVFSLLADLKITECRFQNNVGGLSGSMWWDGTTQPTPQPRSGLHEVTDSWFFDNRFEERGDVCMYLFDGDAAEFTGGGFCDNARTAGLIWMSTALMFDWERSGTVAMRMLGGTVFAGNMPPSDADIVFAPTFQDSTVEIDTVAAAAACAAARTSFVVGYSVPIPQATTQNGLATVPATETPTLPATAADTIALSATRVSGMPTAKSTNAETPTLPATAADTTAPSATRASGIPTADTTAPTRTAKSTNARPLASSASTVVPSAAVLC